MGLPGQVVRMEVDGMHCSACSGAVERALEATPGVQKAAVSLTLKLAEVTYDPKLTDEVRVPSPHGPTCPCADKSQSHCSGLPC